MIDMIIQKIIRDLTMNLKNKDKGGDSDQSGEGGPISREFTIDEDFFHSVIVPSIYSTIVAGIR